MSWTITPFEEIVKRIKQLSPRLMIGDFGCGEAKILSEFGDKRVYSFDHVAVNNKVTACDMKTTGLPDEAIDIAIFSLSLMGRNWSEYIAEAKRCLATGGYLLIADTTKSIKGRPSTLREIIKKQVLKYIQMKREEILHLLKQENFEAYVLDRRYPKNGSHRIGDRIDPKRRPRIDVA